MRRVAWSRCMGLCGAVALVLCVFGGGATAGSGSTASAKAHWVLTDLGTLGGKSEASSEAVAINARGQIIGNSYAEGGRSHAFLWQRGRMTDLGTLGGKYAVSSEAVAINDLGQVIGNSYAEGGRSHAFLWQRGRMIDLGTLGGKYGASSEAVAINSRGQVIGSSDGKDSAYWTHAFLWSHGRMIDLGNIGPIAVNDGGQVLGSGVLWQHGRTIDLTDHGMADSLAFNNRGQVAGVCRGHPCLWQSGKPRRLADPSGDHGGVPLAINDHGEVVGFCLSRNGAARPCSWEGSNARDLGDLGGNRGRALDVNDNGQIVGRASVGPPSGKEHAFVWQNGHMSNLPRLRSQDYSEAVAINDRGQIVGDSEPTRIARAHAVLWTLVRIG